MSWLELAHSSYEVRPSMSNILRALTNGPFFISVGLIKEIWSLPQLSYGMYVCVPVWAYPQTCVPASLCHVIIAQSLLCLTSDHLKVVTWKKMQLTHAHAYSAYSVCINRIWHHVIKKAFSCSSEWPHQICLCTVAARLLMCFPCL